MKRIITLILVILISYSIAYSENDENTKNHNFPKNLVVGFSNGRHIMFTDLSKYLKSNDLQKVRNNNMQINNNCLKVYPNPAINDDVILEYISSYTYDVIIYGLQDNMEKSILFEGTADKGVNKISINLDGFNKGLILIYCSLNGQTFSTKLMKY